MLDDFILAYGASFVITVTLIFGALVERSLVPGEKPQVAKNAEKVERKKKKVSRKPVKDDDLLSYFQGNPGASDTQAAGYFGVTRQAIGQRRRKLYSVHNAARSDR